MYVIHVVESIISLFIYITLIIKLSVSYAHLQIQFKGVALCLCCTLSIIMSPVTQKRSLWMSEYKFSVLFGI